MSKNGDLHKGHRERLRKRFQNEGFEHFEMHNVLEFFLGCAIPRRDTNDLAHELIRRFGSLAAVLDADREQLMEVPGVSEYTATLLTSLPQLMRVYLLDKQTRYETFDSVEKLGSYLVSYYFAMPNERVVAVLLNNASQHIVTEVLAEGSLTESEFPMRRLCDMVVKKKAAAVVLAHNHPDGINRPSEADEQMTSLCRRALQLNGIRLIDHIVVGGTSYYGIISRCGSHGRETFFPEEETTVGSGNG